MLCYIHIPFCDSKCYYCSFNSYTNLHDRIDIYMQALYKSIKAEIETLQLEKNSIETLFIGGGTPSVVAPKLYRDIFKLLYPYFVKDIEITIEANPNSATKEWLKGMIEFGVNRISFGVQSFNANKLKLLNRAHSAKEAINCVINAANIGFKNISIDLIYDFKSDSIELIKNDLDRAFALPINHISSYELTIEKATPFYKEPSAKKGNEELGFFLRDYIVSRGFNWYEVSNYGLVYSKHNLGYWQHKEYLGFGAGAVGFFKRRRYYPHTNIDRFIKEPSYKRIEKLSKEDILTEKIFLGLRSIVGVEKNILPKKMQERADMLCGEKKLELKDGIYYNKEYFLSDALALFIMGS